MNYYFITGTSSGIGRALVLELLNNDQNKIAGYARRNTIDHNSYCHQVIDLSDTEALKAFHFPVLKEANRIVLINNAGTLGDINHLGDLTSKTIIEGFNVNVAAVAVLSNAFIQRYQELACDKIIVNVSSGAANSAYDGWSTYCSSKAAINMLTEVIEKEQALKELPVKAFAIAPGVVDTYMQTTIRESNRSNFSNISKFHELNDSGRLYEAKDVAKRMIELIEHPSSIETTISRIAL